MAAQLSEGLGSKSKLEVQAGRWLAHRLARGEWTVATWWAGRIQDRSRAPGMAQVSDQVLCL